MSFKPEHHERPENVWYDKEKTQRDLKALAEIFEESRPAFDGLIDRLKEPLREGRWESVLGDDVSGRLPALVIGDLMARVARERGRDAPSRFFIPGRRQERSLRVVFSQY